MLMCIAISHSCLKQSDSDYYQKDDNFSELMSFFPDRIIVDMNQFYSTPAVKSDGFSIVISKDALDYDSAKCYSRDSLSFIQVPVEGHTLNPMLIRFTTIEREDSPWSSYCRPKVFVLSQFNTITKDTLVNVVTIVPQPKYMTDEEVNLVDCFNLQHLNGLVFYSNIYGDVLCSDLLINGKCLGRYSILKEEDGYDSNNIRAKVYLQSSSSDEDSDIIDPAIVIGEDPNIGDGIEDGRAEYEDSWIVEITIIFINPGGGGGSGDSDDSGDSGDSLPEQQVEVITRVEGNGRVNGAGYYNKGDLVVCRALPAVRGDIEVSKFISWSGYIVSEEQEISFKIKDENDCVLVAKFEDSVPRSGNGKADPLMEMKIQGTVENGVQGGKFGTGRGVFHNGIDLVAPIGTPAYSVIYGVVSYVQKGIPLCDYEEYLASGGTLSEALFNIGNAVYISGDNKWLNGFGEFETTVFYWHLDDVDVNVGDIVQVGQQIGTTGVTGAARDFDNAGPHLHFGVKIGNVLSQTYSNPEDIFYALFDKDGENIIQ